MTNSALQSISNGFRNVWPRPSHTSSTDRQLVARIREHAETLTDLTAEALRNEVVRLKEILQADSDHDLQSVLVPACAVFDEGAYRAIGIRYYDVQMLAGLALSRNSIAEMKTGEGKTYVGGLASFVHALRGQGAHFMTTNAYLAERDYETVLPIFNQLGMTVGKLGQDDSHSEKLAAYQCDVTYGPGYNFGFDYLRDQLTLLQRRNPALGQRFHKLQRGRPATNVTILQPNHSSAIVDELDSVLIDEATTPLILSVTPDKPTENPGPYLLAGKVAAGLLEGKHYSIDLETQNSKLTALGDDEAWQRLDATTRSQLKRPWTEYIERALKARLLLRCDVDYIVGDDKVKIVDKNTGRVFEDRSWSDGLHQAVQAYEGVTITDENHSVARISRQQYFGLYDNLSGMTGTATGSEREFWSVYRLPVRVIPTRMPCQRRILPQRFFATEDAKWQAIAEEVVRLHAAQQPILIGTRTIDKSEIMAEKLIAAGIPFQLLNGKQDADEARIVARAGQSGAVTIATNMAGRGTDIKLGPGVRELGGLHVIVTEPHDSARVDRQLIGRAARQGDPGSCQAFVSADDTLITQHAPWLGRCMQRLAGDREVDADVEREVAQLQRKVERKQFNQRRQMFAHQGWLEDALSKMAKD